MALHQPLPVQGQAMQTVMMEERRYLSLNALKREKVLLPLRTFGEGEGMSVIVQEADGRKYSVIVDFADIVILRGETKPLQETIWITHQACNEISNMLASFFAMNPKYQLLEFPGERNDGGPRYYVHIGTSGRGGYFVVPMNGGFTVSRDGCVEVDRIEFKTADAATRVARDVPKTLTKAMQRWVFENILKDTMNLSLSQQ